MPSLPPAVASFDAPRFLGTWFIIATNYAFWKRRIHPTVTYGAMVSHPLTWSDRLCFEVRGVFGQAYRAKVLDGVDRQDGEPGRFLWRGAGLLRVIRSPWCVVAVGPAYDWAVTYFARSNVGTSPGVDIYARTPSLQPEQVADILREVRASAFMSQATDGMFETVQKGVEPGRYGLSVCAG
jgi:lipocalin